MTWSETLDILDADLASVVSALQGEGGLEAALDQLTAPLAAMADPLPPELSCRAARIKAQIDEVAACVAAALFEARRELRAAERVGRTAMKPPASFVDLKA